MARGPNLAPEKFTLSLDALCIYTRETQEKGLDCLTWPVADGRIKRSTYDPDIADEVVNKMNRNVI